MPAAINTMARALRMTLPQMYKALEVGAIGSANAVRLFTNQVARDFPLELTANLTVRNLEAAKNALFELKSNFGKWISYEVQFGAATFKSLVKRGGDDDVEPGVSPLGYAIRFLADAVLGDINDPDRLIRSHNAAMGYDNPYGVAPSAEAIAAGLKKKEEDREAKRAGAGLTTEERIKAVTDEIDEKAKLNDLLLREVKIRKLLGEVITSQERASLQQSLDDTLLFKKRELAEGKVEKLQVDVEIATRKRDQAKAARQKAEADFTAAQAIGGSRGIDMRADASGRIVTTDSVLREAELALTAAQQELQIESQRSGNNRILRRGSEASPDVTDQQRLSAYAGGPQVAMLDVQRSMDRRLGQVVQLLAQPRRGGNRGVQFSAAGMNETFL